MSDITIEAVEAKLDSHYRDSVHTGWTYKVTCLNPLVITAFATADNSVRPNDVVPFHICRFDAWCTDEYINGPISGEIHNGKCTRCGVEYKPALIIELIRKARL